ncbi:toxin-antitoxin system YwqK family antitoxin [Solitalea canadensis]|nr:hypothetical protein [Solitalea canadensis]
MKLKLFYFTFVITLFACKNEKNKSNKMLCEYYPNGNIKALMKYDEDKKVGYVNDYYEDGQIEDSISIVNNLPNGYSYRYRRDGKIETIRFIRNDRKYASVFHFDKNQKVDYYGFHGLKGQLLYGVEYDSSMNVKSEMGKLAPDCNTVDTVFAKGTSFLFHILIPTPPHMAIKLEVKKVDMLNNQLTLESHTVKEGSGDIMLKLDSLGYYKWIFVTYFNDTVGYKKNDTTFRTTMTFNPKIR